MKYHQGKYKPVNPKKYIGNASDIVFRSGLELKLMRKFDVSPNVVNWTSETVVVPYYDSVKSKARRYFPDFVIRKVGPDGKIDTLMVEVKPYKQTFAPVHKPGKRRQTIIMEEIAWKNNQEKWQAAREYCSRNGWKFVTITEKEIGGW